MKSLIVHLCLSAFICGTEDLFCTKPKTEASDPILKREFLVQICIIVSFIQVLIFDTYIFFLVT